MANYIFVKSIKIKGVKKNVYLLKGTKKQYVNYKGKKIRLGKYKKLKAKCKSKKCKK